MNVVECNVTIKHFCPSENWRLVKKNLLLKTYNTVEMFFRTEEEMF